jgi:phage-related protein
LYNSTMYNSKAYNARAKVHEGGSFASVAIVAQGKGIKYTQGSAGAVVAVVAQGKGIKYTQGSFASVAVVAQGTGAKHTAGSSQTGIVVTMESGGLAIFNGASEAAVVVAAESTGAKTGVGASEAVIVVGVEGAGRRLLFKEVVVANDGAISHISLKVTGESQYELMPPTRDKTEQVFADGEVDFGTMLDTGEIRLFCTTADGLTVAEKRALQGEVAGQLNALREYFLLKWECMPDKALLACLVGRAEFIEYADGFDVVIPLKYQPLWVSTVEHTAVGSGTITNTGTFEAPFVVEITGDGTSPSVTVGGEVMQYDGTLAAGDKLVIDTGKMTAKVNNVNAMAKYNRVFPKLQVGDTAVVAGDNTMIKWRDCWI